MKRKTLFKRSLILLVSAVVLTAAFWGLAAPVAAQSGGGKITVYFELPDGAKVVDGGGGSGGWKGGSGGGGFGTGTGIGSAISPGEDLVEILDPNIPLGALPDLPKTGSNALIPLLLFAGGAALLLAGVKKLPHSRQAACA